jgi:hypothetical protein
MRNGNVKWGNFPVLFILMGMFIMSLPLYFNVTLETLPQKLPYLSTSQAAKNKWKDKLPQGFKVGLVWKGSTIHVPSP